MRFKVGEAVKFLNEKGGGKVKRIQPDGMVLVEVDGFDIPFSPSELVKLEIAPEPEVVSEPKPIQHRVEIPAPVTLPSSSVNQLPEGVYLAFIPEDENRLLECPIEVTLYNKTSYSLYYTLLQKEVNKFFCAAFGEIKPQSTTQLLKVLRSELEMLSTLRFQGIKFKKGELEPHDNLDLTIKLKPVKFYKENNYQDVAELGTKALLVDLSGREMPIQEKPKAIPSHQGMLGRQAAKDMASKKRLDAKLRQFAPIVTEEEVDLHIEEILDDHRGMTNGEIIHIQLMHFQKKLDEAIAKHYNKITFIHGVGKGRLKEEILLLLKGYKNIQYRNAPYEKYGYGATEVIIK